MRIGLSQKVISTFLSVCFVGFFGFVFVDILFCFSFVCVSVWFSVLGFWFEVCLVGLGLFVLFGDCLFACFKNFILVFPVRNLCPSCAFSSEKNKKPHSPVMEGEEGTV